MSEATEKKTYYERNKEKKREYQQAYYQAHKNDPDYIAYRKIYEKEYNARHRAAIRERRRSYKRAYRLVKEYPGFSEEAYQEMLKKQGGRCAICKCLPKTFLYIDHNHRNNQVRGLLCNKCNLGLGYFNENPLSLEMAILYLDDWRQECLPLNTAPVDATLM